MDKYIACTTKKQWRDVLKKFEEDGYRWIVGNSIMSGLDYFDSYKCESVIHVHPDTKKLEFGNKEFYRGFGKVFISAHDFLKGSKTNPIVISRNGNTVTAEDKNTGEKGVATCSPSDKFDFKIGAKIALARLWGEEVPKSLLNDDEKHTFKTGDRVVVRDWDDMQKEYGVDSAGDIMRSNGGFVRLMKHLCGRTATVTAYNSRGGLSVTFDDESGDTIWYFTDWMFKPFVKTDTVTKFKVDNIVTLKDGLTINEAYSGIQLLNGMYDMGHHKPMRVIEVCEPYEPLPVYKCVPAERASESGCCCYWFSEEMLEKYEDDDEIRENDIVEVVEPLQCYDTYTAWIVKNIASVELAAKFVYCHIPKTDTQYRVIKIASHSGDSKLKLAYIQDKTRDDCFIMNLSALKKVKK